VRPPGSACGGGWRGARSRNPLQDGFDVAERLPAIIWIPGQTAPHDPVKVPRWRRGRQRRRVRRENRRYQGRRRRRIERTSSGRHLIDDGSKSEDVAALVGRFTFKPLRRKVMRRAEDRALDRAGLRRAFAGGLGGRRGISLPKLRETEVEHLHPGWRDEYIGWLQVPVHHTMAVRILYGIRDFDGVSDHLGPAERPTRNLLRERFSLQELHDKVQDAAVTAGVVHGADPGVIQGGGNPAFLLESPLHVGSIGQSRGNHLDRDEAPETRVARPVYLAHPAAADEVDNLVVSEDGAAGECHAMAPTRAEFSVRDF